MAPCRNSASRSPIAVGAEPLRGGRAQRGAFGEPRAGVRHPEVVGRVRGEALVAQPTTQLDRFLEQRAVPR